MKTIKTGEVAGTDDELLKEIRSGKDEALVKLYKLHRKPFIHWAIKTYDLDEEKAADIYQDTLLVLHKNVMKGKLVELSSSLKTYVFGIGKNLVKDSLKRDARFSHNNIELTDRHEGIFEQNKDKMESDDRIRVVANLLDGMGEPCKSILKLYYFKSFSMDAIAEELDYKNENVVKTQKLRCLNELKKRVKSKFSKDDLL